MLQDEIAIPGTVATDPALAEGQVSPGPGTVALDAMASGAPSLNGPGLSVVLLNLPWASFRRPSIQLGLLGAIARQDGHRVELAHLNLELAAILGKPLYDAIAEHRSTALGDWLFARAAYGIRAKPAAAFVARYRGELSQVLDRADDAPLEALLAFRETGAERFLQDQLDANPWAGTQVFGLTSTFQQNTACFAMARLLKAHHPEAVIVAGGANFDGEMGLEWARTVPDLDIVVTGEGDIAFPRLLSAIAGNGSLDDVPSLILADGHGGIRKTKAAPMMRDMDALPIPDYDDYFERAQRTGILSPGVRLDVDLPVETSRGCWWGERRHCTFCGLNGETMAFRAKSSERAKMEFAALTRRYRSFRLFAVDNIADMRFHKTLFPDLAEAGTSYDLFYEVKSGLSAEHLRRLKKAGVARIQPGIESLSTHVLALMNKGVRAIANVNMLRWSAILGIDVSWNLLWGFPGETEDDYRLQSQLAPHLFHLQPPVGASRIWLERFSPLFSNRTAQPDPIIPELSLALVYPDDVDLVRAAYFFEYDFPTDVPADAYAELSSVVGTWKDRWTNGSPPPQLEYRYSTGFLQIDDTRDPGREGIFSFDGDVADLYRAMTLAPLTMEQLCAKTGMESSAANDAVEEFCAFGLAMRDGEQVLALALPHDREGLRA